MPYGANTEKNGVIDGVTQFCMVSLNADAAMCFGDSRIQFWALDAGSSSLPTPTMVFVRARLRLLGLALAGFWGGRVVVAGFVGVGDVDFAARKWCTHRSNLKNLGLLLKT